MSPRVRLRSRMSVVLHLAIALIIMILLGQLWLFTVTIEKIEGRGISPTSGIVAVACSLVACLAICSLIRLFLRAEVTHQAGESDRSSCPGGAMAS